MAIEIRKPDGWDNEPLDDLMAIDAGQAYVVGQLTSDQNPIQPEHSFRTSRTKGDPAWYEIYEDGSLWYVNNAVDEIFSDYRDFVTDSLLPGLEASSQTGSMFWTQDEVDESDDINALAIDDMDRKILTLYCDGDEDAAREMAGLAPHAID